MKTDFGNSSLGDSLGFAAVILAVLLGMGGCGMLWNLSDRIRVAPPEQAASPSPTPNPERE